MIFGLICLTFIASSSTQPSPFGFNIQFIGKSRYVSAKDEKARNFCNSILCVSDANSLFTRSSQYEASDPCVDFANFSLGTAMDVGPPNDRVSYRGFVKSIDDKLWDRFRRILMAKDDENEENLVKNARKLFKMYIKSDHALRHIVGHKSFVEFVSSLGGSPYLSRHLGWNPHMFDKSRDFGMLQPKNSSALDMKLWNEENFEIRKLAFHEPESFLRFFFDLELKRCPLENSNAEILCFDTFEYILNIKPIGDAFKRNFENSEQILRMLEVMNDNFVAGFHGKIELKTKMFEPALKNFESYLNSRHKIYKDFKKKPKVIKIKELKNFAPQLKIDWLRVINFQQFKKYQLDENDEIQVNNLEIFEKLAENILKTPKEILADFFVLSYSYENDAAFMFHHDESYYKTWTGSTKSVERWAIGFNRVYIFMPVLLQIMYDRVYGDAKVKKAAESFVAEAVIEAKKRFIKDTNLPLNIAVQVLVKLKRMKIKCGFDEKSMNKFTLESFYAEFPQNENVEIFPKIGENKSYNYLEMRYFGRKITTSPKFDEQRLIFTQACDDWVNIKPVENYKYDMMIGNLLSFPQKTLMFPFFHPERPRFFNMATIYPRAIYSINSGIKKFVKEKFNVTNFITGLENPIEFAYESYKKWLKTHCDLQIGANFLTNSQLFWVARAVVEYRKLHRNLPIFFRLLGKYNNEFIFKYDFHGSPGFQEAFKCPAYVENREDLYRKLDEVLKFGIVQMSSQDFRNIFETLRFLI